VYCQAIEGAGRHLCRRVDDVGSKKNETLAEGAQGEGRLRPTPEDESEQSHGGDHCVCFARLLTARGTWGAVTPRHGAGWMRSSGWLEGAVAADAQRPLS
jgi:hypothetical protein